MAAEILYIFGITLPYKIFFKAKYTVKTYLTVLFSLIKNDYINSKR